MRAALDGLRDSGRQFRLQASRSAISSFEVAWMAWRWRTLSRRVNPNPALLMRGYNPAAPPWLLMPPHLVACLLTCARSMGTEPFLRSRLASKCSSLNVAVW